MNLVKTAFYQYFIFATESGANFMVLKEAFLNTANSDAQSCKIFLQSCNRH